MLNFKKLKDLVRAYDNKIRKSILDMLELHGRKTVKDILSDLDLKDQSALSQQLSILRRVGLVKVEKDGKFRIYSLNKSKMEEMKKAIKSIND